MSWFEKNQGSLLGSFFLLVAVALGVMGMGWVIVVDATSRLVALSLSALFALGAIPIMVVLRQQANQGMGLDEAIAISTAPQHIKEEIPQKVAVGASVKAGPPSPSEMVIVYDGERPFRVLLPRLVILENLDISARRVPETDKWRKFLGAGFGAAGGVALGSLIGFVLGIFNILPWGFVWSIVLGGVLLGLTGATLGWFFFARLKRKLPIWVVRRVYLNGKTTGRSIFPVFHQVQNINRWKGTAKVEQDQETGEPVVMMPAGVPVQSASFLWHAVRSPHLVQFFRGGWGKMQKIQLVAVCGLAVGAMAIVFLYAISTNETPPQPPVTPTPVMEVMK